ncbi:hypothetical protein ACFLXH_04965 [Chloroflexota bacterium]
MVVRPITKILIIIGLLITASMINGCAAPPRFEQRLHDIVKPHVFSIAKWEFKALFEEVKGIGREKQGTADGTGTVIEYFNTLKQIKNVRTEIEAITAGNTTGNTDPLQSELVKLEERNLSLNSAVEKTLEKHIKDVLSEQGIYNPAYRLMKFKTLFPPMNFRLEKPPNLIVVSPRERIESIREITLQQEIDLAIIEDIESRVDTLNVSSLVVELGGFAGTYPSFVTSDADLKFTLDTAAEEWLHQYLTFKPLGFRYLLDITGIARNYEIATMNETVASMTGKEISAAVYEKYYASYDSNDSSGKTGETGFNFNLEMREIRRAVEIYLAAGETAKAERYMTDRRQYLAEHGYYIRKLNQAYFAFHGTYADRPTSISPIGLELKELRARSKSTSEFLETAAAMTSRQDLQENLRQSP